MKPKTLEEMTMLTSAIPFAKTSNEPVKEGLRIGMIGLDTSHSPLFAKDFNAPDAAPDLEGYKVVAAYPNGSKDIYSSVSRIPRFTEEIKTYGVEVVDSIPELLDMTDVIMLETNDGRLHLEQAIQVYKAGKRLFIDKPVTASLTDAFAIYQAAKDYNIPMFSSSSIRFLPWVDEIVKDQIVGKILGAGTYGPCPIEATHSDFFWYGMHGIELLYAIMGTGCQTVSRIHTPETDFVTGTWDDNRLGSYRGSRAGRSMYQYGGYVFGEKGIKELGDSTSYYEMLVEIARFFKTGIVPVSPEVTLELYTFMEAADESKRRNGAITSLEEVRQKALAEVKRTW